MKSLIEIKHPTRSIHSFSCGSIKQCPICGRIGQLKKRVTANGSIYYQVDHWKIRNNHASGYDSSCYLRTAEQEEKALDPRNRLQRERIRSKLLGREKSKWF